MPCKLSEALSGHSLSYSSLQLCFKEQYTSDSLCTQKFSMPRRSGSILCCPQYRLKVPSWVLKEVWELHLQQHSSDWGKISNKWEDIPMPRPFMIGTSKSFLGYVCVQFFTPRLLIALGKPKCTFHAASLQGTAAVGSWKRTFIQRFLCPKHCRDAI